MPTATAGVTATAMGGFGDHDPLILSLLDVAHPKRGDTLQLPLMADFATDPIQPKKSKEGARQQSLFDSEAPCGSGKIGLERRG
jgi:hypothetical protein